MSGWRFPLLLLVSGAPASGKTRLSLLLSEATGLYRVSKAEVARALDVTDSEDASNHGRAWETYWTVLETLVDAGVSVVADQTTWRGKCDEIIRTRLLPKALVRNVHCVTGRAQQRWTDSLLSSGRSTAEVAALRDRIWPRKTQFVGPLDLGCPVLDVETTDGYAPGLDRIVAFVSAKVD